MDKTYGLKKKLIKIWQAIIIEKIITHGAGFWEGDLPQLAQSRLSFIQRLFLLQMSQRYIQDILDGCTIRHIGKTSHTTYAWLRTHQKQYRTPKISSFDGRSLIKSGYLTPCPQLQYQLSK